MSPKPIVANDCEAPATGLLVVMRVMRGYFTYPSRERFGWQGDRHRMGRRSEIAERGADAAGTRLTEAAGWVCFPELLIMTQGLLAEARLTLGWTPQPLWGCCDAE